MPNEREILSAFTAAAGDMVAHSLNQLNQEKKELVAKAIDSGEGEVRLVVVMEPLIVVGALYSRSGLGPPVNLFRIDGDPPQTGETH